MKELSADTLGFIQAHRHDDVRALALQAQKHPSVDIPEAVVQIAGWQVAEKKIPSWAQCEGIRYPFHLSMEQCSSEVTARYKASLAEGETFADLTGGLGVDCSFMARRFRKAEPQVRVHCADGVGYLRQMEPVDWLYLDPARRDSHGGKTVDIADCEPDIGKLEPLLVEKGKQVMVKLSPMLDIAQAFRALKCISQIHIVAVNNECKELIILLKKPFLHTEPAEKEVTICCEQIVDNLLTTPFAFTLSEERNAVCQYATQVGTYLYEPGAALLKGGAYRLLASRYGVKKLHPNSHLYTSDEQVAFPGRCFRVEAVSGFGKKELKACLQGIGKANLTVRNFPASVAELRKKLKLKEGGDVYFFATTLKDGEKVLIRCIKSNKA